MNTPSQSPESLKPPQPPKVGRPDGLAHNLKKAPENVRTAAQMWWVTCGLQALLYVTQYLANIADPRALYQQAKQALEANPALEAQMDGAVSIDVLVAVSNTMMLFSGLGIVALFAWLTWRASRGGPTAATILKAGTVYLVISAVMLFLAEAPSAMATMYVLALGIFPILSAVSAVVAWWFFSQKSNSEWLGLPSDAEIEKYADALDSYNAARKNARKQREKRDEDQSKTSDDS